MKRYKCLFISLLLLVILVLSGCSEEEPQTNKEPEKKPDTDVQKEAIEHIEKNNDSFIIYQNVPEAEVMLKDDNIQLKGLKLQAEGEFFFNGGISWSSSDERVAEIDENGLLTIHGETGESQIIAEYEGSLDYITVQVAEEGEDVKAELIKEEGDEYSLLAKTVARMTPEEKLGQMLMPNYLTENGKVITELTPRMEKQIKDYHLGGVVLFRENLVSVEQTVSLTEQLQQASERYPLLIGTDQEGGSVTRLPFGTVMPGNMALGAAGSSELTEETANAIGEELLALGINMDFAPVLDINNNADNPVIGIRSFGEDPEHVSKMGVSFMKGLQSAGVAAAAKHFPGHGDTDMDSHSDLPAVDKPMDELLSLELSPFKAVSENGADALMSAHVAFPGMDDTTFVSKKTGETLYLPATLSEKILNGYLRDDLGFEGILVTDSMQMGALTEHIDAEDAAIQAINAGADILLMPSDLDTLVPALQTAVKDGRISEERLTESATRIMALKLKKGLIKDAEPDTVMEKTDKALQTVGSKAHKAIETKAAEASITLVKNKKVLPLSSIKEDESILVIGKTFNENLGKVIKEKHPNTVILSLNEQYQLQEKDRQMIQEADYIIMSTYSMDSEMRSPSHPQMMAVKQVMGLAAGSVIGVALHNPYDIMSYSEIDAYIAQYGYTEASFRATASVIFGEERPQGKLPVSIPDGSGGTLYEAGDGLND